MVPEQEIINQIGREHPNLQIGAFTRTSDSDWNYNCIGWAAGDSANAWWPIGLYWPIPRYDLTIENFREAFKSIGYKLGKGFGAPDKIERVAFYMRNGEPTHAARQLADGVWSSKLGPLWDISHTIEALAGGIYGQVHSYMHRKRPK